MEPSLTILFIGVNPSDTTRLRLDREVKTIDRKLWSSKALKLEQAWAVRASELLEYLDRYQPTIVHFSGHGSNAGELLLEGEGDQAVPVRADALAAIFKRRPTVRCVVLNACYSKAVAEAISRQIECVIGMSAAVEDTAAIAFAGELYRQLGSGVDMQMAFESARDQIFVTEGERAVRSGRSARDLAADGEPAAAPAQAEIPQLLVRSGVDPTKLQLIKTKQQRLGRPGESDQYLCCPPRKAWDQLKSVRQYPGAYVLLLCGNEADGHYYFLRRIEVFAQDLEAKAVRVSSNIFELDASSYASLGDSLDVSDALVVEAAAELTVDRNLILLYPEAHAGERAEWLSRHHAQAIPTLFAEVAKRHGGSAKRGIIAVQPLLWKPRFWDSFLSRLSDHEITHRKVESLVKLPTPKVWLDDLEKIVPDHIESFLRELYGGDKEKFDRKHSEAMRLYERHGDSASKLYPALKDLLSHD